MKHLTLKEYKSIFIRETMNKAMVVKKICEYRDICEKWINPLDMNEDTTVLKSNQLIYLCICCMKFKVEINLSLLQGRVVAGTEKVIEKREKYFKSYSSGKGIFFISI